MIATLDLVVGGAAIVANLLGSGLLYKLINASFRESMREVFLTKEVAEGLFMKKDEAAKAFATKEELASQWTTIADHVITPLQRITERLDDLFNRQSQMATDVGILKDQASNSR